MSKDTELDAAAEVAALAPLGTPFGALGAGVVDDIMFLDDSDAKGKYQEKLTLAARARNAPPPSETGRLFRVDGDSFGPGIPLAYRGADGLLYPIAIDNDTELPEPRRSVRGAVMDYMVDVESRAPHTVREMGEVKAWPVGAVERARANARGIRFPDRRLDQLVAGAKLYQKAIATNDPFYDRDKAAEALAADAPVSAVSQEHVEARRRVTPPGPDVWYDARGEGALRSAPDGDPDAFGTYDGQYNLGANLPRLARHARSRKDPGIWDVVAGYASDGSAWSDDSDLSAESVESVDLDLVTGIRWP